MVSFVVSWHSTMIGLRAGAASRKSRASPRVAMTPLTPSTAFSWAMVDWLMVGPEPPALGTIL